MRTILIFFTAIFMMSAPAAGQDKTTDSQKKEKSKTHKHGMKEENEEEDPFPVRKFEYGLNFGAYFANKYSANFYNGTPQNVNTARYVMSNYYWYQDIKRSLNATDTVIIAGYPTDMIYNVGFAGGLFLRVNFNKKNSVFLEANYSQLTASDVITLQVDPYNYYLSYDDLRLEQVIGKEGRVMIDLGYQRSFPLKSRINLFVQGGVTMCYTQMIRSTFVIEGAEYNMVNVYGSQYYVPNSNQQTFYVNQNAFGFGGYLGVGAGIPLNYNFGIEPGFFAHYYPVNLQYYPDFKPSFGLYLRILLHFGTEED